MMKISIVDTLEALRKEIALLGMVRCAPMHALISQAQCDKNQEHAAEFAEHQADYFQPWHLRRGKSSKKYRCKNYGFTGETADIKPAVLKCLECERFKRRQP